MGKANEQAIQKHMNMLNNKHMEMIIFTSTQEMQVKRFYQQNRRKAVF